MEPQDELQQLLDRQAALKQELTAKKKALQEAQRRQRNTLTRQIRRAQARLSTADRKRRTRRLILIGSYIDSVSQADPAAMTRLRKGLDAFLERDQDRALFGLPPRPAPRLTVPGRPHGPEGHLSALRSLLSRSGPGGSPGGPERGRRPAALWTRLGCGGVCGAVAVVVFSTRSD